MEAEIRAHFQHYTPVDPKQFFHIHCSVCVHVCLWLFPRASERRVLPIVGVCKTPSHLHTFSSSHLLIFTSSHPPHLLLIFSSSHLLIFTSSHLHIFSSSHLLLIFSSSPHLLIFSSSSHLHVFSRLLTSSHIL